MGPIELGWFNAAFGRVPPTDSTGRSSMNPLASGRRHAVAGALVGFLLGVVLSPGGVWGQSGGYGYRADEVLIKFAPGTSQAEIDRIRGELGATRIRRFSQIGASHEHLGRLSVEQAIARYRGDRRVQYIEPNYVVRAYETPNDPLFDQLWGLSNSGQTGGTAGAAVHALLAWSVFTGSSSVLVGII